MSRVIDNLVLSTVSEMMAKDMNPVVVRRLWQERDTAVSALREIMACDYRGNEPPEQAIARLALDQLGELVE